MGDSSRCSSAIKDVDDHDHDHNHDHEESGWTSYFEEFEMMNQRENMGTNSYNYSCSGTTTTTNRSIVSAAGSCKKLINLQKKNKAHEYHNFDDSLEDTATSPLSSPKKMSSLMHTKKMKPRSVRYDNTGSPLGKELKAAGKEGHAGNYIINSNNNIDDYDDDEYADLQKRGLCLVPFSMFANYTG